MCNLLKRLWILTYSWDSKRDDWRESVPISIPNPWLFSIAFLTHIRRTRGPQRYSLTMNSTKKQSESTTVVTSDLVSLRCVKSVVRLKMLVNVKYRGNNTFWTSPKWCLGREKYNERPKNKKKLMINLALNFIELILKYLITWGKGHPYLRSKMCCSCCCVNKFIN